MKSKTKRVISLCLSLIMALTVISPLYANAASSEPDKPYQNWMSQVADNTKISSISIPGTHDSATQYCTLGYMTSCQDISIAGQLNSGYRYLDLRLMLNNDKNGFILNHGGFKCRKAFLPWSDKITFDDVCSDAYSFLDANPSETIIFAIKLENSSDDVATCQQLIMDTINKNPDKWYTRNAIPTLGEVRGKIVLAIRYDDVLKVGEEKSGLHLYWEDQGNTDVVEVPYAQTMLNSNNESLWVQDRYKYTIEDKYAAFEEGLDNCLANDDTFFINFLSLSGQNVLPHPKGNANSLNKKFGYKKLQKGTCYGIIIVDRANTEMASKIFETNL